MAHSTPFLGLKSFGKGLSSLLRPGLKRFVVLPFSINFVCFGGLFFLGQHYIHELSAQAAQILPLWLHWLSWIMSLVLYLGLLISAAYLFTLIANVFAAPFNALLAERLEEQLTGQAPPSQRLGSLTELPREFVRGLRREGQKLRYYIPRALLCLLLYFVPIVQVFVPFIWFAFNGWMMALQYLDYPLDNHRYSWTNTLAHLNERRWVHWSFGALIMAATLVPGVNLLVMPAAVAGATCLWVEEKAL